ncbi:conserved hypothetical protein [Hyella patelloides LEGE 07179]|uniref:Uncharacterized protein n=1 Tax=Hyella patelloides LEGE 07179 TaxID=945734 RepID=A0A563VV89_9CYAN|nr:hypothetical protein [Hyella patelloides]VEP15191.1 conserved hypothetical protein [Hyella patelloides LEGE 07179]
MTQNSLPDNCIRPEELMEELGIKKDAYYKDLNYLDIKPEKDSENKCYLSIEQANSIRALRNHVSETGRRNGFDNSSIVRVDDSNEIVSNNNKSEDNIYVEKEEPTANINLDRLMRDAAELAARNMAMPDLIKQEIANRMSEDDLPEDLREKVAHRVAELCEIAREVANPKFTPADIATQLLAQHRNQKAQAQG